MPYRIRKREDKYQVVNIDTGMPKGEHETRKEAILQMRALYQAEQSVGKSLNRLHRLRVDEIANHAQAILDHIEAMKPEEIAEFEGDLSEPAGDAVKPESEMEGKNITPDEIDNKNTGAENTQEREKPSYLKSIGVPDDKWAVKFVARDQIKGYSHLWGNPNKTDIEVEYFTKNTDFWDGPLGKSPRPLTWDHAQDEDFKNASVVIGTITDFGDDDVGRWYLAKLDRSNKYNKAVAELIKQGRLGTSSDSAPQYVERVKTGKATWLKTWPFFAAALTDTPCEPRMIGSIEQLKALGVRIPTATDAETSRKIKYEKAKRERKFLELQTKKD